jgi:hypothetical protein
MVGIKETLEVIDFGMALADAIVKSAEDKKFSADDLQFVFPLFLTVGPAITDIAKVKEELEDLSPEELAQIRDHILAKLPSLGDKWMVTATESLKIAISVYTIIEAQRAK